MATRATSLGYGKKVEWDGREDLVGPGEYKTIRLFDEDSRLESINKKKKKSFGAGREDFDNIRAEIQYRVSEWVPNVKLFINNIIR